MTTRRQDLALAALFACAAHGCGSEAVDPVSAASATAAGSGAGGAGGAGPIGGSGGSGGCAPGELAGDGGCLPAGVAPEACAEGFVADEIGGCAAVLPEACPAGQMAIPGEAACRPIADCGEGPWEDASGGEATQFVDASYVGTDSDGSQGRPWRTIQAGVDAASPMAVVAVAAGSYAESVFIEGSPVRLRGRCPSMVEIVGQPGEDQVVRIASGADGTEIGGVAIRGPGVGVWPISVAGVTLERVWLHDLGGPGILAAAEKSPTSVTLRDALIERATDTGALAFGAELALERSVVRSTRPAPGGLYGWGVGVQELPFGDKPMGRLAMRASVVEEVRMMGVMLNDSHGTIEGSVVRRVRPRKSDLLSGRGINVQSRGAGRRSTLVVRGSLVEQAFTDGIRVGSADATIESTTVRDVRPEAAAPHGGSGVNFEPDAVSGEPPGGALRSSLIERTHSMGVRVSGGAVTIEGVRVVETQPLPDTGRFGWGIGVQVSYGSGTRGSALVRGCALERNHEVGLGVIESEALVERTLLRDTRPRPTDALWGVCATAQTGSKVILRASLVEDCSAFGVLVESSEALLEEVVVRRIRAGGDGLHGDGVCTATLFGPAKVEVRRGRFEASARAGLWNFGGEARLEGMVFECNSIHLGGGELEGGLYPYVFEDLGGNRCGCGEQGGACVATAADLAPPEPLSVAE